MTGQTRSRTLSQVDADIETVGIHFVAQYLCPTVNLVEQLQLDRICQAAQCRTMAARGNKQMPVIVRIQIQKGSVFTLKKYSNRRCRLL
jgi:hypothetical protein